MKNWHLTIIKFTLLLINVVIMYLVTCINAGLFNPCLQRRLRINSLGHLCRKIQQTDSIGANYAMLYSKIANKTTVQCMCKACAHFFLNVNKVCCG